LAHLQRADGAEKQKAGEDADEQSRDDAAW
jgi:hypothetical protein